MPSASAASTETKTRVRIAVLIIFSCLSVWREGARDHASVACCVGLCCVRLNQSSDFEFQDQNSGVSGIRKYVYGCIPHPCASSHLRLVGCQDLHAKQGIAPQSWGDESQTGCTTRGGACGGVSRFDPIARALSRWGSDACLHEPILSKDQPVDQRPVLLPGHM